MHWQHAGDSLVVVTRLVSRQSLSPWWCGKHPRVYSIHVSYDGIGHVRCGLIVPHTKPGISPPCVANWDLSAQGNADAAVLFHLVP